MNDIFNEVELRKLDLNLLLTFSAVMRERSVSKAAERLYLGPSAVSMALNRLRDAVDDPLFVRAGTVMEPTSRALVLWEQIEPALGSIEAAVRSARLLDLKTVKRDVRFAVPDDLEFVLLPRLLHRLADAAPGLRLIVRPSDFRSLLDRIDSGDADLALSASPEGSLDARFRQRDLYQERFAVLYDADKLKLDGPSLLDDWLEAEQVLLTPSGVLSGAVDEALSKAGQARRIALGLSHFATVPFVLRSRPCLVNMPSVGAHFLASEYGLTVCSPPLEMPTFPVSLTWHMRTDADPLHVWFRDLVAEEVQKLRAEAEPIAS
ncbi:MAG: LysR family transcriptional regulator [Devosiaceae bacterium]|nr:LysR family transcriptional regulator [Devosiaceae bacterium MH13]